LGSGHLPLPLTEIADTSIKQPTLKFSKMLSLPARGDTSQYAQKEEFMAARKAPKKSTKEVSTKKVATVKAPMTKSGMLEQIAQNTGLTRKQVSGVFDELATLIEGHLKKGGAGQFTFPGLMKIEVKRKPATKARKGINPFTREQAVFKAKPARNVVKIRALKKVKDMVI
jgi:nucleoid DNA-binding protein